LLKNQKNENNKIKLKNSRMNKIKRQENISASEKSLAKVNDKVADAQKI
jgi:hypothetical protein